MFSHTNKPRVVRQPIPGQAPVWRNNRFVNCHGGVRMTMGLVALEEIVTGSRTRQWLPCAGVNSPNHPPGTWSPDSWGKGGAAGLTPATGCSDRAAPAQTDEPELWCLSALSPALSVTCMCPSLPLELPKTCLVKFPSICSHLLLAPSLQEPFDHTHISPPKTACVPLLITSGCECRWGGGGWKPHITSCIYLSRAASEWHGEWSSGWKVKDSGVNESWPKPEGLGFRDKVA